MNNIIDLTSHNYEGRNVRTSISESGEPLFVGKDVCDILGINQYRNALTRVPEWAQGCVVRVNTLGGKQEMATLKEAGVFWLTLRSDKPNAEAFQRWVCEEVLPALRRQGHYAPPMPQAQPQLALPARAGMPDMSAFGRTAKERIARLALLIEIERRTETLEKRREALFNTLEEPPPGSDTAYHYLRKRGARPGRGEALKFNNLAWCECGQDKSLPLCPGYDGRPVHAFPLPALDRAYERVFGEKKGGR